MVARRSSGQNDDRPGNEGHRDEDDRPMLTSIRTVFAKGIARVILIGLVGLLIVSFGIFGIQDVFQLPLDGSRADRRHEDPGRGVPAGV